MSRCWSKWGFFSFFTFFFFYIREVYLEEGRSMRTCEDKQSHEGREEGTKKGEEKG